MLRGNNSSPLNRSSRCWFSLEKIRNQLSLATRTAGTSCSASRSSKSRGGLYGWDLKQMLKSLYIAKKYGNEFGRKHKQLNRRNLPNGPGSKSPILPSALRVSNAQFWQRRSCNRA